MAIFKKGLFTLFLNLRPFFHLAYPMLFGLSLLGSALSILLIFTPSNVQAQSPLICLSFILLSIYLNIVKRIYSRILAWTDSKDREVVIHLNGS